MPITGEDNMSKKHRKTVDISYLKLLINLRLEIPLPQEAKKSLCDLLEDVLMRTGNYKGFNHLYWMKHGSKEWGEAGKPEGPEKDAFIYGLGGKADHEYDRVYF